MDINDSVRLNISLLNVYIETNLGKDFSILSNDMDAFFIVDVEGKLVHVNQAFKNLIGYSSSELLTKIVNDLSESSEQKDTDAGIKEDEQRALRNFDSQIFNKAGELLDINVATIPIFFQEQFIGTYFVFKDVSSFTLKKRKMAIHEKYYNRLVEQFHETTFILKGRTILNVNHVGLGMLGERHKDQLVNNSILKIIHPDNIKTFKEKLKRVESGEITDLFEQKIIRADREVLDVEMKAFPIVINNERVTHLIIRDVSERNRLSRISEKQAVAGQLAAGIAHEIRNPITAIKGFLQLLKDEDVGNKAYFNIILSEISRIEVILQELLVLAKPNKGKNERVNLLLLLEQVLTLMESQALLNNIEVQKQYSVQNGTVYCDQNQLKQVFINYIKNAIDAMPKGERLRSTFIIQMIKILKSESSTKGMEYLNIF